jgi:hypothetical protein
MVVLVAALVLTALAVYPLWASVDVVRDAETFVPYLFILAFTALVVGTPLAWAIAAL